MLLPSESIQSYFDQLAIASKLEIDDTQRHRLLAFVALLHKWNKAYNLTSVRDPKDMVTRHIFDSIMVTPHLQGQVIADVGTGPGLPGIPLAIMSPNRKFVLIDSLGKRIRFIRQVIYELKLTNVEAIQNRVEQVEIPDGADMVVSRAFASIKDMLHWCQHLVNSDGCFCALKGQLDPSELSAVPDGFCIDQHLAINVPGLDAQRHIVYINKTSVID